MPKIYTKSGDDGTTCLVTGERVSKDCLRVDAYGAVDELNAALGLVLAHSPHEELAETLRRIQSQLFDLGADLACPEQKDTPLAITRVSLDSVNDLERRIDSLSESLPLLRQFILPGGGQAAAFLHLARTVCRRAERRVVTVEQREPINHTIILYLNRLSDLLFVMARYQNQCAGIEDPVWTPRGETQEA